MKNNREKIEREIRNIENLFALSCRDICSITQLFLHDMKLGLAGRRSSLKMIPTFVGKPDGNEKGRFISLDLGGTNFRVVEIVLKGKGVMSPAVSKKFIIGKKEMHGSAEELFDFIAGSILIFLKEMGLEEEDRIKLGFTFSFPVKQTGISSGKLIRWTKGFKTKGVVGHDIVCLLEAALKRQRIYNIDVVALANDTVGTLVALAYREKRCDAGVILGTGTNACYLESISNIRKSFRKFFSEDKMVINIEWGNFDKLKRTRYDKILDSGSINRGFQILEKMVSGMFLGELARIILRDAIDRSVISLSDPKRILSVPYSFDTRYMSEIEGDDTDNYVGTKKILSKIGISGLDQNAVLFIKKICHAVSLRGARISAAALAAVVCRMDKSLSHHHVIAMDGTLYAKHPGFHSNMKKALGEIFKSRSGRIRLTLSKDGSGVGAAIIAAVSSKAVV